MTIRTSITTAALCAASLTLLLASAAEAKPTLTTYLTSKKVRTVEEVKASVVSTVKDGDPLFVFIQVEGGSLADVSFLISDDPDVLGFGLPWLRFGVGKAGDANTTFKQCSFALTKSEGTQNNIALSLSPGDLRPAGSMNCFLKTASADKGVWKNEIRFASDKYNSVLPRPLTVDVSGGAPKYKALWAIFEKKIEVGSPEFDTPPDAVDIKDAGLTKAAKAKAGKALGSAMKRFFFTNDAWFDDGDDSGIVLTAHTTAAMTYKKGAKCFYEVLKVTKSRKGVVIRVYRSATPYEMACDNL